MSYEDLPIEVLNRICKDVQILLGTDPESSFIEVLKAELLQQFREELEESIEARVIPQIRNMEIQTACQISKNNEFYAELKKITDHLAVQISKLSDQINLLRSSSSQNLEKLEATLKQLNRKADIYEVQALGKEIASMTPLTTFYQLQEWTQTLAAKADISRIDREIVSVRGLISDCPTMDQMLNEHARIIVDMKSEISKEKTALSAKISEVREMNAENDGKIEMTKNKIQQNNEILSKKINEVMDQVLEKPWTPEIEDLHEKLGQKAPLNEIIDLRNLLEPKLEDFMEKFLEISGDLKEYTTVMARFDEVILTKASKEDIKVMRKIMNNVVLQSALDPMLSELSDKVKSLEEMQKVQKGGMEEAKKEITTFSALLSFQKTQAKDHARILDNMKSLSEIIKNKADKADIYSIFDIMGYREDVIDLSNFVGNIKDMFHQAVVLQHEAMTTFLLSGDPPVTKNRHRTDIAKNLEGLLKKISAKPEYSPKNITSSIRSKKNLSSVASIHIDSFFDDKNVTGRTMSTKSRRVTSAITRKRGSIA